MKKFHLLLMALVAVTALLFVGGCDRLKGDENLNQAPDVRFINTPFDSTSFSYAPTVYWIGYDPDGLISGYEFFDDSSQAGRDAYRAGDAALAIYVGNIADDQWVHTVRTQETIYLGTVEGETKEHVFFLRSIDNKGERSQPKVRTFFRTNQAPNPPELKWSQGEEDYAHDYPIPDTLFWGDTLTTTYSGIEFLWRGSDPDSRELNIIPLEFSYALVRVRDENGAAVSDTVHWPIYNDSARVIGYGNGFTPWSGLTSVTYFGQETGEYQFTLRVRDDGLTLCAVDSFATASFYAIKPTFDKQLLVIFECSTLSGADRNNFGGREPDSILADYNEIIPTAYQYAELMRQNFAGYDSLIPYPLEARMGDNVVIWRETQDCASTAKYPYYLMGQFKWIWWISDDNCANADFPGTEERVLALSRYMNVGGNLLMSGRRYFGSSYFYGGCPGTNGFDDFFATYFNVNGLCAKPDRTINAGADFAGAITSDAILPDLTIDSSVVCSLRWAQRRSCALPGIEYVSRAVSQTSFDFSATVYNYASNTVGGNYDTTNVDCQVFNSTPSRVELLPAENHNTILAVHRVYNRTRGVSAQFQYLNSTIIQGETRPLIVCSTPSEAGRWLTSDTLEVDYTFSPVTQENNRPVGIFFQKHSAVQEFDSRTNEFRFTLQVRFRTALYTFPISFMDRRPVNIPGFPFPIDPVSFVIANHILQFNSPANLGEFNFDIGG